MVKAFKPMSRICWLQWHTKQLIAHSYGDTFRTLQLTFDQIPSRWPEQVVVEQQQLNKTIEQELIPQQANEQQTE